jgi:hypothetical protein
MDDVAEKILQLNLIWFKEVDKSFWHAIEEIKFSSGLNIFFAYFTFFKFSPNF